MKILAILALILTCIPLAFACSIFSIEMDGIQYLAGNEDYRPMSNSLLVVPPKEGSYGYLVLGPTHYMENYPQIAINEKGLAMDGASVPNVKYNPNENLNPLEKALFYSIMEECATVEEAIEFIALHEIPLLAQDHLILCDPQGSVVIEWHDDELIVLPREQSYQLITNFKLIYPQDGWYPCPRYERGLDILDQSMESSEQWILNALEAMHSQGDYPTLYSYIFNLNTLEIEIYLNHDFSKKAQLILNEDLWNRHGLMSLNELNYR